MRLQPVDLTHESIVVVGCWGDDDDCYRSVHTSNCILGVDQRSLQAYSSSQQEISSRRSLIANANIDFKLWSPDNLSSDLSFTHPTAALTHSFGCLAKISTSTVYDGMTAVAPHPPDSPPELTGSKSSKSSSLHSSSLSGTDGSPLDITNFEDIILDEDYPICSQDRYGFDNIRLSLRSTATAAKERNRISPRLLNMRELTNKRRTLTAEGEEQAAARQGPVTSLRLPCVPTVKRGLTSPSTPTLAMTAMMNLNRSRSPSPSQADSSTPPRLIPQKFSSRLRGIPAGSKRPPCRRGSWQPSRKSLKQLEDEYDDLDEDVPEDASLWNVPLSPRPASERTSISAINSANTSPNRSPERAGILQSSFGNAGVSSSRPAQYLSSSSASRTSSISPASMHCAPSSAPNYPRDVSSNIQSTEFQLPKRSKTWNEALSELSEDAKTLTEAFEIHAEISDHRHEEAIQNRIRSPRLDSEKLSRAKSCPVELPPLRVGDLTIDPLPASKEKEQVLSRTRPSWLPPKNRKEEKKHVKEYQRMMEQSLEAGTTFLAWGKFPHMLTVCRETKSRRGS